MTASPRRRVALFGTFDVENYGDLLFPLVARARLAAVGAEIIAVSPTSARTRYRDSPPALSQAEFNRDPAAFDAVLIGGGNIVHLRDFGLPGYGPTAYPALWAGSTAYARRHGLPVLWNAPGVLAPPTATEPPDWLRRVVAAADHFAVRDRESADALVRWSGRRPLIVPDTALDLPLVWPRRQLLQRYAEIRTELGLQGPGPVIAVHVKARSLSGQDPAEFATMLGKALAAQGAHAILLAIGRCHGDHDLAETIHAAAPQGLTSAFGDVDSLQDIAAVIAGADAYLGASLHGHITAAAYQVPARLIAVPALDKFPGQARLIDRSHELVAGWPEALADLPEVLASPRPPLPKAVAEGLEAHWDAIYRHLAGERIFGNDQHGEQIFMTQDIEAALAEAARQARPKPSPAPAPQDGSGAAEWNSAQVDRLIGEGSLDAAALAIDTTLAKIPKHLPARLAQVRLTLARGQADEAVAMGAELIRERPENPWTWLCQFQVLAKARRHADAVALFRDALARLGPGPDGASVVHGLNAPLPAFPAKDQIDLLRAALTVTPDDGPLLIRLAMRAHASGDGRMAAEVLARAEQVMTELPAHALRLKSQLLPLSHGMAAAAEKLFRQRQAGATDVETLCRLSRFAAAAGRFDLAHEALFEALDLHPMEWRSLYRLNRLFPSRKDEARIFDQLSAMADNPDLPPSWRLQFGLFALRAGQTDRGRTALSDLATDPALGATSRALIAALDVIGPARPRVGVLQDNHVRVVRHPGARATLVLFAGFAGFSQVPEYLFDGLLAEFPANVIYLRDPHGQVFLHGIPELGADEAAMQTALARLVAELGAPRLVTMGNSAAGYAALRNGLALGADQVLSFAGFATPSADGPDDPAHARQGFGELFPGDPSRYDLRPALAGQSRTRLVHVLGGAYRPDLLRARDLDGIAQAEVHVLPGVDSHHVALHAMVDGTLQRLLAEALTGLETLG